MTDYFKALGDDNRLMMMNLLFHYDLCVCELEVILDLSQSNVSRHLAKLKQVKMISGEKDGQWIHYKVDDKFSLEHTELCDYLQKTFESHEKYADSLAKCKKYVDSDLSCQDITHNRGYVEGFLMKG